MVAQLCEGEKPQEATAGVTAVPAGKEGTKEKETSKGNTKIL
jgi:hypothetical protein